MLTTTVLKRDPPRFNMVGQLLTPTLSTLDEQISAGLARRLYNYATARLDAAGFLDMCRDWTPEVFTTNGDDLPVDRWYTVRFRNSKDGYIDVTGILTRRGWPFLDHGFNIGTD